MINVSKGQKIDITKGHINVRHLLVGVGWQRSSGYLDLDTAAFLLGIDGKVASDDEFIFYGNLQHHTGCVEHKGDKLISNSNVDEEQIAVNLDKVPSAIDKIEFTMTIYDAKERNQNFGMVKNAYIRVMDTDTQKELLHYDLGAEFSVETAIVVGEIYRYKGDWKFNAIGSGYQGGLSALCQSFGIEVSEEELSSIKPAVIEQKKEKISLVKGEKISLSKKENSDPIIIENGWSAKGKDYDLKALVRYRDGRLIYVGAANDDEVLSTPEGAVVHGGDVKDAGSMENIKIKWHPDIASVALSSYSALENGIGSFRKYGVFVRITNGKQIIEIPAKSTSSRWFSYTLCFGEIIFGKNKDEMEVSALEMYSKAMSENRVGYKGDKLMMDIGPVGRLK